MSLLTGLKISIWLGDLSMYTKMCPLICNKLRNSCSWSVCSSKKNRRLQRCRAAGAEKGHTLVNRGMGLHTQMHRLIFQLTTRI